MKSFKQMRIDGEITRADAEKIQYKDLYIEPDFNPPGRTEGDDADDEILFEYIKGGGRIPDLEVRPREGGGVWIVDGHRRHKQIGRAIESGNFLPDPKSGKFLIPIKQFVGNDVDRIVRIATSNEGKKLSPLDVAYIYKKLTGFGLTPDDIAKRMHKTRAHVEQVLVLASANHDVHRMVNAGEVSASLAAKVVRKNGERAGEVLGTALAKATASGKRKVTAATIKPTSKAIDNDRVVDALNAALQRAASMLPYGYQIRIEVERDAGGVKWIDPDGESYTIDQDGGFTQEVLEALNRAIAAAAEGKEE